MKSTILLGGLFATATSAASTSCSQSSMSQLAAAVTDTAYFCQYYLASSRSFSPVSTLSSSALTTLCKCVQKQSTVTVPSINSVSCNTKYGSAVQTAFKDAKSFCQYMEKLKSPITSPIDGLTVNSVMQGCKCILDPSKSTSKTTAKTSSKTTAKVTITNTIAPTSKSPSASASSATTINAALRCPTNPATVVTAVAAVPTMGGDTVTASFALSTWTTSGFPQINTDYYLGFGGNIGVVPYTEAATSCASAAAFKQTEGPVAIGLMITNSTNFPGWQCVIYNDTQPLDPTWLQADNFYCSYLLTGEDHGEGGEPTV